MINRIFRLQGMKGQVPGRAVKSRRKGWQDTSRTPISRKAKAFHGVHAGASVGKRAARKKKGSDFRAPNGTMDHSQREVRLP